MGLAVAVAIAIPILAGGCRTPKRWREQADAVAGAIISETQQRTLGRTERIDVDSPAETLRRRLVTLQNLDHSGAASLGLRDMEATAHWDREKHLPPPPQRDALLPGWDGAELSLSLLDAIQVAARNSREFQDAKDRVFRAALSLDLERDEFRRTFTAMLSGLLRSDDIGNDRRYGFQGDADGGLRQSFRNGAELTSAIAFDLAKLLSQEGGSSLGVVADMSVSIPLLRGAGRFVTEEPLRQAERSMVYAIYDFERYKRTFAVGIASEYLNVLRDLRRVENQEDNYRRLVASTRRARRLADSGRMPEFQFDQAVQDELRAREGWIQSMQGYERSLDRFKVTLGLPPDARLTLVEQELETLRERAATLTEGVNVADYTGEVPPADAPVTLRPPGREGAGDLELDGDEAVRMALEFRCDLRTAQGRVEDAQRAVMVAADALRAELTLLGSAQAGQSRGIAAAGQPNAALDLGETSYSALLRLNLPLKRTRERNAYRDSLIRLEKSVRDFQALEDQIKLQVRDRLRVLQQARETVFIQSQAVRLAERRVASTDLFLQAGRAAIRDVLEAQDALLSAQNSLSSAMVSYRIAELEIQRDLDRLEVTADGIWAEYRPERN